MNQVDKLAKIRSQMDDLKKQEAEIVNSLKSKGTGTYPGTEHYAIVSESTTKRLNMKEVRAKLSRQFIQANTNETTSIQLRLMGYSKKFAA